MSRVCVFTSTMRLQQYHFEKKKKYNTGWTVCFLNSSDTESKTSICSDFFLHVSIILKTCN